MDATEAERRLKRMVAWDKTPALSQQDIDDLLADARRPDASGRPIADPDWVPTWDLNYAAWKGWEQKLSDAAAAYTFSSDQKIFNRSDIFGHCQERRDSYRRKASGGIVQIPVVSRYR